MKVYQGNVLSVNSKNEVFRFLVEDKGKILFVGDELPEEYRCCEIVALGQRALIPTFCDTHQHFASFALFNAGLNVMAAKSNTEILEMASHFYQRSHAKTLIAFGASPYSVEERRLVSREELDRVCPDKPFFMVKYDGHACVVNTVLLRQIEDKCKGLRGYHPDSGEMNQEAFFAVSDHITASIPVPELIHDMMLAVNYEASMGIGMVHSVSGVGFPKDLDIHMETWFARGLSSGFQLRVFPQKFDAEKAVKFKLGRVGGCFQCALDGCFGSTDAALLSPYANDNSNSGVLYYTDEQVTKFCKAANRAGMQIELHAIGDRAFAQAAAALKAALDDYPRDDHRHGIIHACLTTEESRKICADYHIQLPMQVSFDNWRQEPAEYTERILGRERNTALNPVRTMKDLGCTIGFGSDGPCTDPNPIVWLYKAVNHSNPNERVSIQDALRMSTYNGYWISFDEQERGSLETGKVADMVILSHNPYKLAPEELMKLRVEQTILRGKEFLPETGSFVRPILKGIFSSNKA